MRLNVGALVKSVFPLAFSIIVLAVFLGSKGSGTVIDIWQWPNRFVSNGVDENAIESLKHASISLRIVAISTALLLLINNIAYLKELLSVASGTNNLSDNEKSSLMRLFYAALGIEFIVLIWIADLGLAFLPHINHLDEYIILGIFVIFAAVDFRLSSTLNSLCNGRRNTNSLKGVAYFYRQNAIFIDIPVAAGVLGVIILTQYLYPAGLAQSAISAHAFGAGASLMHLAQSQLVFIALAYQNYSSN